MRGALVLWLVLMAAYAATLGLRADGTSRYSAAEAHRLLVADSIVHDHDVNVDNQYRERAWRTWYPRSLKPAGVVVKGRRVEPAGLGTPLLIAPAYALDGPTGVELWCAALLAAAFVAAAAVGRRLVPDPWATRGALALGLSPPALAASTTVAPEAGAAFLLAAATLMALRLRDQPRAGRALRVAAALAIVPWLSVRAAIPAAVVALTTYRWLRRRQRGLRGFVVLEAILTSVVVEISLDDRLYDGLTPASARLSASTVTGAASVSDWIGRLWWLLGELIDRDVGVLRWAPVLALSGVAAVGLVRARRERLSKAISGYVDVEVGGALCGAIVVVALGVGAFAHHSPHGGWLVVPDVALVLPVAAPLVALGMRRTPRSAAVLTALTLAASAWLLIGARVERDTTGLAPPHGALPWGGAQRVLPRVG